MVGTTSMTSMEPLEKLLSRALHSPFPTTFYATVNFLRKAATAQRKPGFIWLFEQTMLYFMPGEQ